MIRKETEVKIMDNSGGIRGKCIQVYKKTTGREGDEVLVSIKKSKNQEKIKKGSMYKGIIVQVKKEVKYKNGMRVKYEENGIVIMKRESGQIVGKRVKGRTYMIMKRKKHMRIVMIAQGVI